MLCGKEIPKSYQANKIECGETIGGEKKCIEYKEIAKHKFEKLRRIIEDFKFYQSNK